VVHRYFYILSLPRHLYSYCVNGWYVNSLGIQKGRKNTQKCGKLERQKQSKIEHQQQAHSKTRQEATAGERTIKKKPGNSYHFDFDGCPMTSPAFNSFFW
jgi:hypothetical protein